MSALDISLVLDRILLFASHKACTFAAGLELLQILTRIDLPDTHRYVIRRLVGIHVLSTMGHLDLLQLLPLPLSDTATSSIAVGAATAGHVRLLDWTLGAAASPLSTFAYQTIAHLGIVGGHTAVLDWIVEHGTDPRAEFNGAYLRATRACQPRVLDWLKAYTAGYGLVDNFAYLDRHSDSPDVAVAAQIATLDWWKAEYAARDVPMFPMDADFVPKHAWCCAAEDQEMLVVDWWRTYCSETGREFKWAELDSLMLWFLVRHNALSLCKWWWSHTVETIGIEQANEILGDILFTICEYNRVAFLNWYWDLCVSSGGAIEIPRTWRPRTPFTQLSVIQWWEAKVEDGLMESGVFDIVPDSLLTKLDAILNVPTMTAIEVSALDWWWARRDRFGLDPRLSHKVMLRVMVERDPEILHWYLDRCTPESPLPVLTLDMVAKMISLGRVGLIERLLSSKSPLDVGAVIELPQFQQRIASSVVLDYLWDHSARAGVRFEPCYNSKSAIKAMTAGDLDASRWFYAMHLVHGTGFPSVKELGGVICAPGGEMERWIRSIPIPRL
ncbi:hypothetical protein BC828DRAFT_394337 [Blastocladiella britannica]|nr:hypothetical protein BC828DRAFT_394337 [Blastocladiella britannica]